MTFSWPQILSGLVAGQDQPDEAMAWAMGQILAGEATPVQIAGFAVALRSKGETVAEISGLADTMLAFATPIDIPGPAVDIVGSGGDRANTVNISTMAAIVAAGAVARVAKHGNRSASSASGAADVLEALGLTLDLQPEQQRRVIDQVGIGFLFAAHYHRALRHAASARSELGVSTTFNFLGPLANPARPKAQAVGVADARMAEVAAGVLARRGTQGLVFHGGDGLDELTTTTSSAVWSFVNGEVTRSEFDPAELGIPRATVSDLVGGDPVHNAGVVKEVLAGAGGPVRDIVVLNAAAGLVAFHGPTSAGSLYEAFAVQLEAAENAIDSGAAQAKLNAWIEATHAA